MLKRTLELFLEPLIAQLESPSRLTQFAAEQCVAELRDMVRGGAGGGACNTHTLAHP